MNRNASNFCDRNVEYGRPGSDDATAVDFATHDAFDAGVS